MSVFIKSAKSLIFLPKKGLLIPLFLDAIIYFSILSLTSLITLQSLPGILFPLFFGIGLFALLFFLFSDPKEGVKNILIPNLIVLFFYTFFTVAIAQDSQTLVNGNFFNLNLAFSIILFSLYAITVRKNLISKISEKFEPSKWILLGNEHDFSPLIEDFKKKNFTAYQIVPSAANNFSNDKLSGVIINPEMSKTQAPFENSKILSISKFYEKNWKKIFFYGNSNLSKIDYLGKRNDTWLKRNMDYSIALLIILVTLPLCLLVMILIKATDGGPIFYKQKRKGIRGEIFEIYKFRSMRVDAEKSGAVWAAEKDNRITWIGQIIRKLRIDELPQVINILKGEMSLIGPRPERPEFTAILEEKIPYYKFRESVLPGITGWAQVSYPYGASIEDAKEKHSYDLYYIKNISIPLDLLICLKTLKVLLLGKGR